MIPLNGRRPLWVPLLVWGLTATLAVAITPGHMVLALCFVLVGGLLFGWLSARREDARTVRIRRRVRESERSHTGFTDADEQTAASG